MKLMELGTTHRRNVQVSVIEFSHTISYSANVLDIKFDVIFEDYDWVSSDSSRAIELVYSMQDQLHDNSSVVFRNGRAFFNNLYFVIGPTQDAVVTDSQGTYNVSTSLTGQDDKVAILYSNFPSGSHFDSLIHDPNLGVLSPLPPSASSTPSASSIPSSESEITKPSTGSSGRSYTGLAVGLPVSALVVVGAVIAAAFYIKRHKSQNTAQPDSENNSL